MWKRWRDANGLAYLNFLFWCLVFFAAEWWFAGQISFPADDAWIHAQFARNLVTGNGLSYNPGEPVPGFSSATWVLLSALGYLVTGDFVISMRLWAILAGFGCIYCAGLFGRLTGDERSGRILQWAMANSPLLVANAMTGLESVLFAFLVSLGLWWHWAGKDKDLTGSIYGGCLWGIACLTRMESLAFYGIVFLDKVLFQRQIRDWFLAGLQMVVAFLLVLPWLLFNYSLTGSPFPATFSAKAIAAFRVTSLADTLFVNVLALPLWVLVNNPVTAYLSVVGLWVLWKEKRWKDLRLSFVPLLFYLVRAVVHRWVAMSLYFTRYYLPTFLAPTWFAGLGLTRRPHLPWWFVGLGGMVGCLWAANVHGWMVQNTTTMQVRIGLWLKENTPANALIATNDVGAIAFFSQRRILDTMGLVSPEITPIAYPKDKIGTGVIGAWEQGLLDHFRSVKPDYLVVFPRWYPWLTSQTSLLQPLLKIRLANNVICGDDTMVVYKFLWDQKPVESAPDKANMGR
ncbi:MAG: hypothetical protein NZ959_05940 [Armatimonadetes bacterium]|nr:hypothetical protein [Armatimonadota bacterium]MDW8121209.1 hypothetical protein [Armatimonadota bacterium]